MRIVIILVLICTFFCNANAQQDSNNEKLYIITDSLLASLSNINGSMIKLPDWYMSYKDIYKGRDKISRDLVSKLDKFSENEDQISREELFLQVTNVSLWYSEITSEDFQIFMRRFVTGRPISKDVIIDFRESYIKWIKNPTIKNLNRYSQLLLSAGKSYEILTRLQVTVDNDQEIEIKYRPINTVSIETLSGPSTDKKIPVGNYFVWLEKDGKVISDKINIYACITSTKKIVLGSW